MPIDVILHKLDPTGINPDNLVENEIVPITTTPIDGKDLNTPKFGYFFTESVVLQVGGVDVPRNKYRFTEYFHKASLKYGKQICGSILVDVTGITSLVTSNLGPMATSSGTWGWTVLTLYFKSGGATYATTDSYDSNGKGYPRITSVSGAGTMRFMTSQLPPNIATASDLTMVGLFSRYGGMGS